MRRRAFAPRHLLHAIGRKETFMSPTFTLKYTIGLLVKNLDKLPQLQRDLPRILGPVFYNHFVERRIPGRRL